MLYRTIVLTAIAGTVLLAGPALAQSPSSQDECYAMIDRLKAEAEDKSLDSKAVRDIGALLRDLQAYCGASDLSGAGSTVGKLKAMIARMPS